VRPLKTEAWCTKLNTNAMRNAPDGYTINDVLGLCIAAAPDPSKDQFNWCVTCRIETH